MTATAATQTGTMPISVSLTEWLFPSITINVNTKKPIYGTYVNQPCQEHGK